MYNWLHSSLLKIHKPSIFHLNNVQIVSQQPLGDSKHLLEDSKIIICFLKHVQMASQQPPVDSEQLPEDSKTIKISMRKMCKWLWL